MKKTALISVYHKKDIEKFAKDLFDLGWEILASGGTAKYLAEHGVVVRDVAELVGGKAIFGHRVVTLSREIHAGLLARKGDKGDMRELERLGVPFIDLVCVDLYPLEEVIAKPSANYKSVVEATDVGGPTLVRSAAKGGRIVICDPEDREKLIEILRNKVEISSEEKRKLAAKAEYVVAKYCLESAKFHSEGKYAGIIGEKTLETLYGENPHQAPAGLYSINQNDPLALDKFKVLTEMAPSYNNLCDLDRMLQTMAHLAAAFEKNNIFTEYFGVAVKHGNACGASYGNNKIEVIKKVVEGDPRAIFGGLAMFNFDFGEDEAEILFTHLMENGQRRLLDGVIVSNFSEKALKLFRRKKDKCRFIVNSALANISKNSLDREKRFRYVRGGFLMQPNYTFVLDFANPEVKIWPASQDKLACRASQGGGDWENQGNRGNLLLAWAISATSNSNTITLVKDKKLIGNGVGQQDRVNCCELAIKRAKDAGHDIQGAVAASDSFFPFPDAPQAFIDAGVKIIFSTSGSVGDEKVQKICRERGVTLVQISDKIARGFFGH